MTSCLFGLILFLLPLSSPAHPITSIRERFAVAVNDAGKAEKLLNDLQNTTEKQPLLLAYRGAAEALMARYAWNPISKMTYLRKSQKTLAEAIRCRPDDAEMRFLRFSIQHYVPAWLGFSSDLEEDRKTILGNLPKTPPEVRAVIVRFLLECGRCTPAEVGLLRQTQ